MDLLQKYKGQKREKLISQQPPPPPSFQAGAVFSGLGGIFDTLRQSRMMLVVMSGVMLTVSLVLIFDVVSPIAPKIEPLPVGAFPTLDLRRAEGTSRNSVVLKNNEGAPRPHLEGLSKGAPNDTYASGRVPFASQ